MILTKKIKMNLKIKEITDKNNKLIKSLNDL